MPLYLLLVASVFVYEGMVLRITDTVSRKVARRRAMIMHRPIARILCAIMRYYGGLKLHFERKCVLPEGRALIVANHQSLLDIVVIIKAFMDRPVLFVSKKELGRGLPLVSRLLVLSRHCLIDRKHNMTRTMRRLENFMRSSVARGFSPVIFPEGTRSKDGSIGPFHTAGVRKMIEVESLPLIAVAIDGGYLLNDLGGLRRMRGKSYKVTIVKTFAAPKDKYECLLKLEEAREAIAQEVERMREGEKRG